jgi:hypothetical protein
MSEGEVSYLNTVAKLMQNWGYVYSVLLDFMDNSNVFKVSIVDHFCLVLEEGIFIGRDVKFQTCGTCKEADDAINKSLFCNC